jgi:predicted nucleic acid-binding protein
VLRSSDQLIKNRIEVLEHRRSELQQKIVALEIQLGAANKRYDRQLQLHRREALLGDLPPPDERQRPKVRRDRAQTFRQGYVVGLLISLTIGLLSVAAR